MRPLAAVVAWTEAPEGPGAIESLVACDPVGPLALAVPPKAQSPGGSHQVLPVDSLWSSQALADVLRWFASTDADFLLLVGSPSLRLYARGLDRLIECARTSGAVMAYGDTIVEGPGDRIELRPLLDYQPGSLRDDFEFGPLVLMSRQGLAGLAGELLRADPPLNHGAFYDLRLRLSERGPLVHLPEPLCAQPARTAGQPGRSQFDYVDPRNRAYQIEQERVATAHLERIGAWLPPPTGLPVEESRRAPVEASVIIPVKNRARTVGEAVESALSQQAPFDFNVIVVDNHSDDGTSDLLADLAGRDRRLVHLVPARRDLGIGGCWNEAIDSAACGRYAVQLDSDDLYSSDRVLERMLAEFERSSCAMLVGSYTLVDFDRNPIPPGLIDHREWTAENGHNNALRIHGLGAPRAFHVATLRTIGFPNVSYGEDYAVGLRLCRSYRIGRIYDSLYWCRRWEGNTDSGLTVATSNRYHAYKDWLRSIEIAARQKARACGC